VKRQAIETSSSLLDYPVRAISPPDDTSVRTLCEILNEQYISVCLDIATDCEYDAPSSRKEDTESSRFLYKRIDVAPW
jgi:hypothetical protein